MRKIAPPSTTRLIAIGGRIYDAEDASESSRISQEQMEYAARVGCFFCERVFSSIYVDTYLSDPERPVCPYCHVDALLIESPQWPLHPRLLAALKRYHFW